MNYGIINADVIEGLAQIESESIQCCVTSPPYWGLRDYGVSGQIGLEKTPEEYVAKMVEAFRAVRRVLKKDGVLWLNLGDSYWGGKGQSAQAWSTEHQNRQTLQKSQHQITGMSETRPQDGKHETIKPKDLVGIPWRVAFALQADGWWLRSDVIWAKGCSGNYRGGTVMPESVTDRPTKAHEYIFLLTKSAKYYYDADAIAEPISESYSADMRPHGVLRQRFYENSKYVKAGMIEAGVGDFPEGERATTRNRRSVWVINPKPFKGVHFATFPDDLIEPCIKAGSRKEDTVLDPFCGSGTTGEVALRLGRKFIGIELNDKYVDELIAPRLESVNPLFAKTEEK